MTTCTNCHGLIMEPNVAYGYAGKVCHCPIHPSRKYQNPASNPLRVAPMFANPEDLERYMQFVRHRSTPDSPYVRIKDYE